ncbi:hypothetical protein BQ8794_130075 [Mesorhizobium prunaredense]|uniref:Uncharacterized protein n=1 Tax=Mesorhizobium prunaredense TaxID=1631249 RepID=A0A1R3V114_9HYPH|nr:hypothetical protein BQ8794_130075 [Mesorhizobium prunaredense]
MGWGLPISTVCAKIPFFCHYQGSSARDQFASDCDTHQSVRQFWRFFDRLRIVSTFPWASDAFAATLGGEAAFSAQNAPNWGLRLCGLNSVANCLEKRCSADGRNQNPRRAA